MLLSLPSPKNMWIFVCFFYIKYGLNYEIVFLNIQTTAKNQGHPSQVSTIKTNHGKKKKLKKQMSKKKTKKTKTLLIFFYYFFSHLTLFRDPSFVWILEFKPFYMFKL